MYAVARDTEIDKRAHEKRGIEVRVDRCSLFFCFFVEGASREFFAMFFFQRCSVYVEASQLVEQSSKVD